MTTEKDNFEDQRALDLSTYLGKWGLGEYILNNNIVNGTNTIMQLYNSEDGSYAYIELYGEDTFIIDQQTYEDMCWLDDNPSF